MAGIMKMETVVLNCQEKDMPLFNMDRISVLWNNTLLAELYDTCITGYDVDADGSFSAIRDSGNDLKVYETAGHWYSNLLLPCTFARKTAGKSDRLQEICLRYTANYLEKLKDAPACERTAKQKKTGEFVQGLLDNGGPAVNQFRKLFGEETTVRLISRHMYGI